MPRPHLGRESDREAGMISLALTGRKYPVGFSQLQAATSRAYSGRALYRNAPLSVETSNHPKKVFDFPDIRRIFLKACLCI